MQKQIHRVVLTGGPGTGKTTCLELLRSRGYAIGEDAARNIIRERKRRQLPPRPDGVSFSQQILEREIEAYNAVDGSPVKIYERGVVDAVGYLLASGVVDDAEAGLIIGKHPYDLIFLLPPWQAIYRTDAERDHTYDHSVRVYDSTLKLYRHYQYEPIEIPVGSPESRVDLMLSEMGNRGIILGT